MTRRPGKPHPVQGQAGTSTLPAESQVGRRAAGPASRQRGRWMAVHDRIRLTGQLREGPASAGASYFARRRVAYIGPCPTASTPRVAVTWIERVAGRAPRARARRGRGRGAARDPRGRPRAGGDDAHARRGRGAGSRFPGRGGADRGRRRRDRVGPTEELEANIVDVRNALGPAPRSVRRAPLPPQLLLRRVRQGRARAGAPGGTCALARARARGARAGARPAGTRAAGPGRLRAHRRHSRHRAVRARPGSC